MVFFFKEPLPEGVKVEFHSWEAKITVSNSGRVAALTSMPWNQNVKPNLPPGEREKGKNFPLDFNIWF